MKKIIKHIGLDVHKNFISIAVADQGSNGERLRCYRAGYE